MNSAKADRRPARVVQSNSSAALNGLAQLRHKVTHRDEVVEIEESENDDSENSDNDTIENGNVMVVKKSKTGNPKMRK